MKTLKLLAVILFVGFIAISCKKEGPAGKNGTNGNANVQVFGYSTHLFNWDNGYSVSYSPAGLSSESIFSSVIYIYYTELPGIWHVANGLGPNGDYATIQYMVGGVAPYVSVYLMTPEGNFYSGTDVTWDSARVFFVPATVLKNGEYHNIDFRS